MEVKGVNLQKMIDSELLGMHKDHPIHLNFGKFGYYLRYDGKNYSLPAWASPNLSLYHAVKIIDYKINKQKQEVEKKLETRVNNFQNYKHAFEAENDG
jgi:topoisomerase IA-like protein